jgi:hypothetical protein
MLEPINLIGSTLRFLQETEAGECEGGIPKVTPHQ